MHAFDDARGRVELGDAPAQLGGVAVALGDEDGAGAGQVGRRLAQGAAREQPFGAEGLLAVNQDNVLPPAAELPGTWKPSSSRRVSQPNFSIA